MRVQIATHTRSNHICSHANIYNLSLNDLESPRLQAFYNPITCQGDSVQFIAHTVSG